MDTSSIQTIIIVAVQLIVGGILLQQIKSQKQIINNYKGLVEATNPEKIITLHNREIEQLVQTYSSDKELLNTQIFELSNYVAHMIGIWERGAKELNDPNLFNQTAFINLNMPHCSQIIHDMQQLRQSQGIE